MEACFNERLAVLDSKKSLAHTHVMEKVNAVIEDIRSNFEIPEELKESNLLMSDKHEVFDIEVGKRVERDFDYKDRYAITIWAQKLFRNLGELRKASVDVVEKYNII